MGRNIESQSTPSENVSGLDRLLNTPISRRTLLTKYGPGLVVGAAALTETQPLLIRSLGDYMAIRKDWDMAGLSNDEFLQENRGKIRNLTVGCSFAPEEFGLTLANLNTPLGQERQTTAMSALRFAIEDLGMRNIRLGPRWNETEQEGELNLSLYSPMINYLIQKGVNITLSIGEKNFRWPEIHIPQEILDFLGKTGQLPPINGVIRKDSELAKLSLEHTAKILLTLQNNYSPSEISKIVTIQPQNEPFDSFGDKGWTIDPPYLSEHISLASDSLPHANILVNAGTLNQSKSTEFLKTSSKSQKKLVSGVDYYPRYPGFTNLPFVNSMHLDSIFLSKLFLGDPYSVNKENAPYLIEVTEGQTEPWGNITSPGNSAREFKFMLQRAMNNILNINDLSLLRIWGMEFLAYRELNKTSSPEQKEIFDLIRKINFQQQNTRHLPI